MLNALEYSCTVWITSYLDNICPEYNRKAHLYLWLNANDYAHVRLSRGAGSIVTSRR